jgi:hypothetical protein
MYNNKTVVILGAGASWHYGYPTGDDLVKMVIKKCKELANFAGLYREFRLQTNGVLDGFFPDYVYARNGLSILGEPSHHRVVWNKFYIEADNLVDKIVQMIPSALWDFREVSACCEGNKRQICTTSKPPRSRKSSIANIAYLDSQSY